MVEKQDVYLHYFRPYCSIPLHMPQPAIDLLYLTGVDGVQASNTFELMYVVHVSCKRNRKDLLK